MQNFTALQDKLEKNLSAQLKRFTPANQMGEACHYAVLPAGKLFRPLLVSACFSDLSGKNSEEILNNNFSPLSLLASFVEVHHAYTLVHDDLPCMDDDDMRRGRPSLHKAYGEWMAVLTGDALMALSFQLIGKMEHPRSLDILRYSTWALGSKGLIMGQVLDLSEEMTKSFKNLLDTHTFKTARLIQTSLVCAGLLADANGQQLKDLHRLGHNLGIVFQFLDDLTEMVEEDLSFHESQVNPWINFFEESFVTLKNGLEKIEELTKASDCKNTKAVINQYYQKMNSLIRPNQEVILGHLPIKESENPLIPIMAFLE